jgi:hypothetical protein
MVERLADTTPAEATIEIGDGAIAIDAAVVARGLGLEPQEVLRLMRDGAITGVCEQGVDADAGRHRLTFFHKSRRLRLIVEEGGRVMQHSLIDFGERPLPQRLHRSGG